MNPTDKQTGDNTYDSGKTRRIAGEHQDGDKHQWKNIVPLISQDLPGAVLTLLALDIVDLGLKMNHHEYGKDIHDGWEHGHQHNFGIGDTGKFGHDKAACSHDRRHEHTGNGGCRFNTSCNVGPESRLFHHRDGKGTCGNGVCNGTS